MKPKNSQRQLIEMYLLQSADEPVAVLNEVELLELIPTSKITCV